MLLDDLHTFPHPPKRLKQWVAWRYVALAGKKPRKAPLTPGSLQLAAVNDPASWSTYGKAYSQLKNGGVEGLGFVFTEEDPFIGIDIDDAVPIPEMLKIAEQLGSYAEWSPSGKGIHIWMQGKLPEGVRRKVGPFELYSSKRYFTVTGRHVPSTPCAFIENPAGLQWFIDTHMTPEDSKVVPRTIAVPEPSQHPSKLSDEQVIEKGLRCRFGPQFRLLMDGQWPSPTQSEADLSLMQKLALLTGGDEQQMERIFKRSQLYRPEKWDRLSYPSPERFGRPMRYGESLLVLALDFTRGYR